MVTESERKIIIRLSKQGKTQEVISSIIGCSQQVVSYWIKRYKVSGSIDTKPKIGRPTLLNDFNLKKLKLIIKNKIEEKNSKFGSLTTKELREIINNEIGKLYSIRHVERIMHKLGFSLITPRTVHTKHNQNLVDEYRKQLKKNFNRPIWIMN